MVSDGGHLRLLRDNVQRIMLGCAGTLYNVEQSENFPSNYFSTITVVGGRNTNGSQASPGPGTS